MTTLSVLGSGSCGNAFVLEADGAVLLVDAGFSARELFRRAELAGVDLGRLCGIALTHEHGDHARGAVRLAERHRVPVLASPAPGPRSGPGRACATCRSAAAAGPNAGRSRCRGAICSMTRRSLALTVTTSTGLSVGIAYDFGRHPGAPLPLPQGERGGAGGQLRRGDAADQRLPGVGAASHRGERRAPVQLRQRPAAQELHHPGLTTVVLAHLSRRCNSPEAARAAVEPVLRAAGFIGRLVVATQDAPVAPFPLTEALELPLGYPQISQMSQLNRPSTRN